ncbi:MAG: hypothetical protein ACI89L_000941 [Phycisphaerales bacterium]
MRSPQQPFPEPFATTDTSDLLQEAFGIVQGETMSLSDDQIPAAFMDKPEMLSVWSVWICTGSINNGGICSGIVDAAFTLKPAADWFLAHGEPEIAELLEQSLVLFFGDGPIPISVDERNDIVSDSDDVEPDPAIDKKIDTLDEALIARFGDDEPFWRVLAWQVLDHPEQFLPEVLERAVRRNEAAGED